MSTCEFDEPVAPVVFTCGHTGTVVERCVEAYRKRYCAECAKDLPKPSDCLRRFMAEHNGIDHFGPMLGPIGAVIYARQRYFGLQGLLAFSGDEAMFAAIEDMEPGRVITPYIERFEQYGL